MRAIPLMVLLVVAACGSAAPEPAAAIEAYTPESLDPNDDRLDDLTITISYDDGDGDLGGGVATITDCRAADIATVLELPPIASPEGVEAGVHITGTLDLVVADVDDLTPTGTPPACAELGAPALAAGEVAFCVVLTDAGGVSGPGDCTTAIPITAAL
jgi:hypothetical protein